MTLNDRLATLLEQSIDEYIRTAAPIASTTLAGRMECRDCARSPATIRNELKILEELGYLHQVHSSSGGRIPTARAYHEYLRHMNDPTFVCGLIQDLQQLSALIERIEHKLGRVHTALVRTNQEEINRKLNVYNLFKDPDLQMSAIYLIIKENLR